MLVFLQIIGRPSVPSQEESVTPSFSAFLCFALSPSISSSSGVTSCEIPSHQVKHPVTYVSDQYRARQSCDPLVHQRGTSKRIGGSRCWLSLLSFRSENTLRLRTEIPSSQLGR